MSWWILCCLSCHTHANWKIHYKRKQHTWKHPARFIVPGKKQENVHQQWQRIGSVKITRSEAGVSLFLCANKPSKQIQLNKTHACKRLLQRTNKFHSRPGCYQQHNHQKSAQQQQQQHKTAFLHSARKTSTLMEFIWWNHSAKIFSDPEWKTFLAGSSHRSERSAVLLFLLVSA